MPTRPLQTVFLNLSVDTDWQDLPVVDVVFGIPNGKSFIADQFSNDQSTAYPSDLGRESKNGWCQKKCQTIFLGLLLKFQSFVKFVRKLLTFQM